LGASIRALMGISDAEGAQPESRRGAQQVIDETVRVGGGRVEFGAGGDGEGRCAAGANVVWGVEVAAQESEGAGDDLGVELCVEA
jgi:hypothetical protein